MFEGTQIVQMQHSPCMDESPFWCKALCINAQAGGALLSFSQTEPAHTAWRAKSNCMSHSKN
jgi:polyferredoxin